MLHRFTILAAGLAAALAVTAAPAQADPIDDLEAEQQLGRVTYEYQYEAGPYAAPTEYECTNRKKVSTNTKILDAGGGDDYVDKFSTRVYYKHCVSLTNYYEKIGLMHLSLERQGVKGCRHLDFDKFYLNPTSIAGVNYAGFDQDCTVGQTWYMRSYEMSERLNASEGDRCFNHNWKYRVIGGNDIEGWSESACFV